MHVEISYTTSWLNQQEMQRTVCLGAELLHVWCAEICIYTVACMRLLNHHQNQLNRAATAERNLSTSWYKSASNVSACSPWSHQSMEESVPSIQYPLDFKQSKLVCLCAASNQMINTSPAVVATWYKGLLYSLKSCQQHDLSLHGSVLCRTLCCTRLLATLAQTARSQCWTRLCYWAWRETPVLAWHHCRPVSSTTPSRQWVPFLKVWLVWLQSMLVEEDSGYKIMCCVLECEHSRSTFHMKIRDDVPNAIWETDRWRILCTQTSIMVLTSKLK